MADSAKKHLSFHSPVLFPSVAPTSTHYPLTYRRLLHRISLLSFHSKLLATMVAIPTALLASSVLSNIPNLGPLNAAVRFYESAVRRVAPPPITTRSDDPASDYGTVLGPVVALNFPDPSIIHLDGTSYAFATNNRGYGGEMIHIQMATSTDNETWTYLQGQDALPTVGAWATGGRVWAPDVVQVVRQIPERIKKSKQTKV